LAYISQPNGDVRRLWTFHGGLQLPDHKVISNRQPITQATIPKQLILPLQQHIGTPAQPLVKIGDLVLKGHQIAACKGAISAAIHAPTSGRIAAISEHLLPHPSGLKGLCIKLVPDGHDTWTQLPEPILDYPMRSPSELRDRIQWAGIVGLGGATFPSNIKLSHDHNIPIETLIINGVECEPYITCDDMLMRSQPERIIEGAKILMHILGAKRCLIAIEDNKPEAIAAIYSTVKELDIQDRQNTSDIEVVRIPTLYPSGGERQLIKILTGKEVPTQGLPAHIGIVCHNVGTTAAIADAILCGRPLISRLVTVTGEGVKKPGNLEVLIGTLIADVISEAHGYTPKAQRLILGGPMMGTALATDAVPINKATNCLLVASIKEAPEPLHPQPCIRCGACTTVCPANLLPQQLYWYSRARNLEQLKAYHLCACIECGCCSHVCPAHIPLVQFYRAGKALIRDQNAEQSKAAKTRKRYEAHTERSKQRAEQRKAKLLQRQTALAQELKTAGTNAATNDNSPKAVIAAAMQRVAAQKQQKLTNQALQTATIDKSNKSDKPYALDKPDEPNRSN